MVEKNKKLRLITSFLISIISVALLVYAIDKNKTIVPVIIILIVAKVLDIYLIYIKSKKNNI